MEVFGEDVTNKEVDQMKMPSQMNLAPVLIIIKKLPFIQIRIMMIADQKKTSIMLNRLLLLLPETDVPRVCLSQLFDNLQVQHCIAYSANNCLCPEKGSTLAELVL